jgi:MFS family permease
VLEALGRRARPGALASGPFARLFSAQVVSQIGTQMNNTAEAWVLYRLTHSALALGAQGLCFSAPIAVLPLLTGALADRFDRLSLVKMTLVAEAAQAFAIAGLAAMGDLRAWVLYLAAGLDAGRLAVNIPAQSALVPNIVPPGLLTSALALSTATWSSSALVGPAVAGALLVAVGPALVFAINGAATIVALAAISTIAVPAARPRPPDAKRTAGLLAGASYLRHNRRVLCLVGMMVVAMTGALGVETLLPVFAVKTWHAGAIGYGLLRMAPGIAAVVAGLGLSARASSGSTGLLGACFVVAAVCFCVFASAPPFALALVVLAVGSLWLTVVLAYSGSEVQQSVPDSLRGRVSAITSMGQNGLAGLGAIAVATAAGRTGAGVAVAGLAVLVGVLGITLSAVASRKPAGPPVPGSPSPGNSGAP